MKGGEGFLVRLWFIYLIGDVIEGEKTCTKDIVYLPCLKNKTFTGHVINTVRVLAPGLEMCQNHCFHDDRCMSYNLGPVDGQIGTCELNDFDHVTFPNDVIDKAGFEFCPIEQPCSSRPCGSSKVCKPDFNLGTFKCYDGVWSSWGPWCKCPTTRSRSRVCRNPFTNTSATDCPGPSRQDDASQTHQKIPKDCFDAAQCGCATSGVYNFSSGLNGLAKLYCDQETAGGGWTVIQRRKDGSVDFYLGWQDYKVGFGDLNGEFWLGLDNIHQLTNPTRNRLRVDLENVSAEYDYFAVDNEANKYTLRLGNFVGGAAGDSLSIHVNAPFTTKDRDNDNLITGNCALSFKGGWWYTACHNSNLNGLYLNGAHTSYADGIEWNSWRGLYYSAKTVDIKIKPT